MTDPAEMLTDDPLCPLDELRRRCDRLGTRIPEDTERAELLRGLRPVVSSPTPLDYRSTAELRSLAETHGTGPSEEWLRAQLATAVRSVNPVDAWMRRNGR